MVSGVVRPVLFILVRRSAGEGLQHRSSRQEERVSRRGFTLIEILVVVVIMGLMVLIAFPRLRDQIVRSDVRGAASRVASTYAQARATAIQTGRPTTLNVAGNNLWVTTTVGGTLDTVGSVQYLDSLYHVTLGSNTAAIQIDARGIANVLPDAEFVVTRGSYSRMITVGRFGSIVK